MTQHDRHLHVPQEGRPIEDGQISPADARFVDLDFCASGRRRPGRFDLIERKPVDNTLNFPES